jgi:hypothetical protein
MAAEPSSFARDSRYERIADNNRKGQRETIMVFSRFRCPILFAAALGGAMALAGCSVSSSTPTGTVTVDFDVDEETVPADCDANGAARLDLDVTDSGGFVRHFSTPCDAFTITVSLPVGSYSADVTLVDSAGNDVTSTAPLDFDIIEGTDVKPAEVDFPDSSFF